MEPIEVLLQLIDRFVQTVFDEVVDSDVAPAGKQLTTQTIQVIGLLHDRLGLDLLQRVADSLKAEPN